MSNFGCKQVLLILSDGVDCTIDLCNEDINTIIHIVMDVKCDDSKFCNGVEICDQVNGCAVGMFLILLDNLDCIIDVCDEDVDVVVYLLDYVKCLDGKFCIGVEICDLSIGCKSGVLLTIDDGIPCTVDVCDEDVFIIIHDL